ncbi:hypothetical protein Tco_0763172, partial [Tanacetum coccineum]
TVGAQSSLVPTLLLDDPYMAVRQAHLVDTDTESEPEEAPSEIEECQPLVSRALLTDEEFEVSEPSDTRIVSSHSLTSSDPTAPLSPDHPLTQTSPTPTPTRVSFHRRTTRMAMRTQPTLTLGMLTRIAEASALSSSSFRKRYRSSYETSSSSLLAFPIRKRYRGTSELVEDTEDESSDSGTEREGLEGEGHSLDDEGPGSIAKADDLSPSLFHKRMKFKDLDTKRRFRDGDPFRGTRVIMGLDDEFMAKGSVPSTFEIGQSSRSMSKHQRVEETFTPMPRVRTTWVDPVDGTVYTDFLVDVPPARVPTLLEGYDRDLRELYTRLRDVRDEIISQRYRLRSLKQEQERATVTLHAYRQLFALSEGWTGNVETLQRQRCTTR